jgi:hypothetical protein
MLSDGKMRANAHASDGLGRRARAHATILEGRAGWAISHAHLMLIATHRGPGGGRSLAFATRRSGRTL